MAPCLGLCGVSVQSAPQQIFIFSMNFVIKTKVATLGELLCAEETPLRGQAESSGLAQPCCTQLYTPLYSQTSVDSLHSSPLCLPSVQCIPVGLPGHRAGRRQWATRSCCVLGGSHSPSSLAWGHICVMLLPIGGALVWLSLGRESSFLPC